MSILCIKITKYKVIEEKIFYKIHDVYEKDIFFASIEPKKTLIAFYDTDKFDTPIKSVDYSDKDKPVGKIKGHSEQAMIRAVINLVKAAENDKFPDDLSYHA